MRISSTNISARMIANYLKIAPRYVRSHEIERDFGDPAAMDGYIITPAVLFATQTLANGLRKDSAQRAWRITGPYGAGKSALGLFLSHLAARTEQGRKLLSQLKREAPQVYATWRTVPRYLPITITGSRIPFGQALVTRLLKAIKNKSTRRPSKLLRELTRLEKHAQSVLLSDEHVIDMLSRFADYIVASQKSGYQGVLLLIDEMGKFLEHAALKPEQADAYMFQRMAELAAGGSRQPIAMVGFLHQNFADYAAGYGEQAQEEWSKVAERFEDIPFDESLEQYGFLLGKAMQYKDDVLTKAGIDAQARKLYSNTVTTKKSDFLSTLVESSPNLYPIHPSTFLGLATAVKRFGQNQRSLFSFLLSGETNGLQEFTRSNELHIKNWYRLPQLYDYLASLDGVSFRQGDRMRKWELLRDTLVHGPKLNLLERNILKVVGLLNVLDPVPYLLADKKTLAQVLTDQNDDQNVSRALDALVEKGVLHFRRAQNDYCLWRHSSVDLQALYEEAARFTRAITTLDDLLAAMDEGRPIIAHRHYQRTGTLRAFCVRYVSIAQLSAAGTDEEIKEYDGEVLVVLLDPSRNIANACTELSKHALAANPRRLIALRKIEQADLTIATEIRIYERIKQTCRELRVDDFARREVIQNLDRARRKLEERLARIASFDQTAESQKVRWLYRSKPIKVRSRRQLSVQLSRICEQVYDASPFLRNELINRQKLSPAISLARQKLIESMLTKGNELGLGLSGMPPEKAIYLSLFRETGLHRKERGVIGFYPPKSQADNYRWAPVWRAFRKFLSGNGRSTFETALVFLRQPPYGMREGSALLFIIAFILNASRDIALFERNTYLVTFTADHAQRLIKSPANFSLHFQPPLDGVESLLASYATALEPVRQQGDALNDVHGIVSCLYRWYSGLSEFAQQTQHISALAKELRATLKRATDPIELLTKDIPQSCRLARITKRRKNEYKQFVATLSAALHEIQGADNALRREILILLNDAFHIQGSVSELRSYLRDQFAEYKDVLGDHKLKAVLTRALDNQLSDDAWIESIGGLLGERAIGLWKDETIDKFKLEAIAFAGKLKRWTALMHKMKPGTAALVSVYVTGISGKEHSLLVTDRSRPRSSSEELKKELQRLIAKNPDEAPLALAEALAELLSGPIFQGARKHGRNR